MSPDLIHRLTTRRAEHTKWRRSPRWKKILAEHAHVPGAECVHCHRHHGDVMKTSKGEIKYDKHGEVKRVVLTINHTDRHLYLDEDSYLTWDPENMEICCTSCNFFYEKGMVPCPECLKDGPVTYIRWDAGECDACYFRKHPDLLEKINQKRIKQKHQIKVMKDTRNAKNRAAKRKHPCFLHRIGGRCGKSMVGARCPYSPTKAPKMCGDIVIKKSAVVRA